MSSTAALAATGPHMPSAKFWDRVAEKYAKSPVSDEAAYRKKLAMTRVPLAEITGPEALASLVERWIAALSAGSV